MSTIAVDNVRPSLGGTSTDLMKGLAKAYAMVVTDAAGSGSTFNQSSITDNGTGDNDHNFTDAFADTNYGHAGGNRDTVDADRSPSQITTSDATGSCNITLANDAGANSTSGYDVQWWGDLA